MYGILEIQMVGIAHPTLAGPTIPSAPNPPPAQSPAGNDWWIARRGRAQGYAPESESHPHHRSCMAILEIQMVGNAHPTLAGPTIPSAPNPPPTLAGPTIPSAPNPPPAQSPAGNDWWIARRGQAQVVGWALPTTCR